MQFRYLKYDLYRYFYFDKNISHISLFRKIKIILLTQGIWAIVVFRIRRWFRYECKSRLLRVLFNPIGLLMNLWIEIVAGIHIGPGIDVGPGLYIGHYGGIFFGGDTKMGKMCNISHECVLGWGGRGDSWGIPELGDFVYVAPGAKVFGKIKIGDHVAIGANAVVSKSLENHAVAVGIPAKVISHKGSDDFIVFNRERFRPILDES